MGFEVREPLVSDLDQCLSLLSSPHLCDPALYPQLRALWLEIITSRCGVAMLAADSADRAKVIGFWFLVFVSDRQVEEYHVCRAPFIARRILGEWIDGHRSFFDVEQVARANAGSGLNLVLTHYGPGEGDSNRVLIAANYECFRRLVRGWNLRTFTAEVLLNPERGYRDLGRSVGYRILEYPDDVLRGAGFARESAPFLWVATREDAATSQGYAVKMLFDSYAPPHAGFSRLEQELLGCALEGHTDALIASHFAISESAVKKHFRRIYEKAFDSQVLDGAPRSRPGLHGRGAEMRRRLLNYLREHFEELRPYQNNLKKRSIQETDC